MDIVDLTHTASRERAPRTSLFGSSAPSKSGFLFGSSPPVTSAFTTASSPTSANTTWAGMGSTSTTWAPEGLQQTQSLTRGSMDIPRSTEVPPLARRSSMEASLLTFSRSFKRTSGFGN
ncbi:hypothetical protein CHLRE_17g707350v5 [Chlamydomonas reinhardtii]|uniref:Uncharacterized protein n=1 Tax=Chlamydomonas reinhardtii TaxID=3055 RepID=A0A2K3CPD9_CHLRE|nr:uncharacterized protein CHLRE_17g707350v5 [Chlamydomonas reinhardtii]PNW70138.1 hypothetical protein CHLRE_17g707350v5 [Chlamydomonas reinhardtii]